ncbi:cysteine dioxygenase [Actinomadura terrae]|uniref:cysteine dioxygenase n=1 Tax=Actinomadura terrae TaxID=604353 RepID=UPI001FA6D57E|nr:cysteine dioxygenase family protein [Actinomadura terrae]
MTVTTESSTPAKQSRRPVPAGETTPRASRNNSVPAGGTTPRAPRNDPFAPPRLAERARALARDSGDWLHRVRLDPQGRWYERIHQDVDHEVWVISWLPGQSTGFHDHGGSSGAFAVALGTLQEHHVRSARDVGVGETHAFGPDYVHDVRNTSDAPAISVHVYSPPLSSMRRYDLDPAGELVELAAESAEDW